MNIHWTKFVLSMIAVLFLAPIIFLFTGFPVLIIAFVLFYINIGLAIKGAFSDQYDLKKFSNELFKLVATVLIIWISRLLVGIFFDIPPATSLLVLRSRFGSLSASEPITLLQKLTLIFDIGLICTGLLVYIGWAEGKWGKEIIVTSYLAMVIVPIAICILIKVGLFLPDLANKITGYAQQLSPLIGNVFPNELGPGWLFFFGIFVFLGIQTARKSKNKIGAVLGVLGVLMLTLFFKAWFIGAIYAPINHWTHRSCSPSPTCSSRVKRIPIPQEDLGDGVVRIGMPTQAEWANTGVSNCQIVAVSGNFQKIFWGTRGSEVRPLELCIEPPERKEDFSLVLSKIRTRKFSRADDPIYFGKVFIPKGQKLYFKKTGGQFDAWIL
ncbi:MAG: hypothetical protein V1698_00040 [bacterium]